jgi:hypothetical protein
MRRTVLALAVTLAAWSGPLFAQEEPPLFENPPASEQPSPSPTPGVLPSAPPASPLGPLPPHLDFARWQVMTARERQTYVEGALGAVTDLTARLREEVVGSKGIPREGLSSVLRFVNLNTPRRAPQAYLKEMERIYMTTEGQKLGLADCFRKAFERLNVPAAVGPPPQAAKTPEPKPPDQ